MSNKPLSFRPSPHLRAYLEKQPGGVTESVNALFDRYRMLCELEAIRLTEGEQFALREHLQGVIMDAVAIQVIPQDVTETGNAGLIEKMRGATFGQVLATVERYGLIS